MDRQALSALLFSTLEEREDCLVHYVPGEGQNTIVVVPKGTDIGYAVDIRKLETVGGQQ